VHNKESSLVIDPFQALCRNIHLLGAANAKTRQAAALLLRILDGAF